MSDEDEDSTQEDHTECAKKLEEAMVELDKAIQKVNKVRHPDTAVFGWVIVTQRTYLNDEDRQDAVSSVHPEGQNWIMTRGMLEVAVAGERTSVEVN